MKHLETFTKWFSKLNTKHKLAIIKKLEEIYEVDAFPELQMKIVSLEAKKESLELTILKLKKELEDSNSKVNKLQKNH